MASNTDAYKQYTAPTSAGKYLKLTDGEEVRLRVVSECYVFNDEYKGKVSTRYAWLIYNKKENKVQVWQAGANAYNQIKALVMNDEWGDPTEFDIMLKREDTPSVVKYYVTPSPNRNPLSVDATDEIAAFDIFDAMKDKQLIPLAEAAAGKQPAELEKKDTVVTDVPDGDIDLGDIPF